MLPIGKRIRNLRRAKNETQEDLSAVLGVTFQAVSRWENGDAYPDIELLPRLAAHFGVTTDELLGADEETRRAEREKRREDYKARITKHSGTKEHFETMRQAFSEFPEEPIFAFHALNDLVKERCMPREEGLPFARELSESLIGTSYQQSAVRMIYQYEDWDKLERWRHLSLEDCTTARLWEERYAYWGQNEACSRQRQINLFQDLNYMIWNDFGKKTADGKEDSASWNEGFRFALRLIDCLRDPSTDEDGWIDLRLWILLRIAGNNFIMGKKDDGYEVLEEAMALLEIIARYPADHTFSFHTPVLDLIEGSVTNDFAMIDLFHGSAASDSEGDIDSSGGGDCHANYFHTVESVIGADSECFASVRDEPRFQSIAARVREMVPKAEVDKLLLSSVRVPRLRAFLKAKTE